MKNKGFTLVELLMVIVLIGLLVAIAVPSVIYISKNVKQKSLDAKIELVEQSGVAWGQNNKSKLEETICGLKNGSNVDCYKISIEDLIRKNELESDKKDEIIFTNPIDNTDMKNQCVYVYIKNKRVYAEYSNETCEVNGSLSEDLLDNNILTLSYYENGVNYVLAPEDDGGESTIDFVYTLESENTAESTSATISFPEGQDKYFQDLIDNNRELFLSKYRLLYLDGNGTIGSEDVEVNGIYLREYLDEYISLVDVSNSEFEVSGCSTESNSYLCDLKVIDANYPDNDNYERLKIKFYLNKASHIYIYNRTDCNKYIYDKAKKNIYCNEVNDNNMIFAGMHYGANCEDVKYFIPYYYTSLNYSISDRFIISVYEPDPDSNQNTYDSNYGDSLSYNVSVIDNCGGMREVYGTLYINNESTMEGSTGGCQCFEGDWEDCMAKCYYPDSTNGY